MTSVSRQANHCSSLPNNDMIDYYVNYSFNLCLFNCVPFNDLSDEELGIGLSETSSWIKISNATNSIDQSEIDLIREIDSHINDFLFGSDPDINCFYGMKQCILFIVSVVLRKISFLT